jgi:hypothetical protein
VKDEPQRSKAFHNRFNLELKLYVKIQVPLQQIPKQSPCKDYLIPHRNKIIKGSGLVMYHKIVELSHLVISSS